MGFRSWYRQLVPPKPLLVKQAEVVAAAEQGDPEAQFALGLRFSVDNGPRRDLVQAAHWYRKAADQDHALAQFNLGLMLATGQGLAQDDVAAMTWMHRSAEGGDAGAQFNLGSRYQRHSMDMDRARTDCAESRVQAYKWFQLASAQGYKGSAAACERISLSMTRAEVVEGNERVAAFVSRKALSPPSTSDSLTS